MPHCLLQLLHCHLLPFTLFLNINKSLDEIGIDHLPLLPMVEDDVVLGPDGVDLILLAMLAS